MPSARLAGADGLTSGGDSTAGDTMITCLISSPRRDGYGEALAARAVQGIRDAGREVAVHRLNEMTSFRQCQSCGGCQENDAHCVLKDDITPIMDEIRDAEGMLFVTSVNFNDTNGLFKLVFDRLYSFLDMNACSVMPRGKKIGVIVTAGADDVSADRVARELDKIMREHFFCESVGTLTYCTWFMPPGEPVDEDVLDQAYRLGAGFGI